MTSEEPPKDEPQVDPAEVGAPVARPVEPAPALDLDRARVLAGAARDLLRGGLHVQARPLVEELAALLDDATKAKRAGSNVIPIDRRKK